MGKQNLFWNGEKRRRLWTTEQKKEMIENRYRGGKAVHKAGWRDNGVLSVVWISFADRGKYAEIPVEKRKKDTFPASSGSDCGRNSVPVDPMAGIL